MRIPARNLVLVSYDSVRADVAFSAGFPGIERLRTAGTTFRNCVSSAPLTPVSHSTVMSGLQPFNHGVRHLCREQLRAGIATLAQCLGAEGLRTGAVVSCPGLNRWYGLDRGFEHYDDEIPRLPDGSDPLETVDVKLRGTALKRASLVVERSREWLAPLGGERFFHFMHFFDAHWPYDPPERPFRVPVANDYEAEIAYLDHHFTRWLDWFQGTPGAEDTLIVLFGDHGEDLNGWYPNDRGGEALGHPEEMGHGCLLYDQTIMVPLVIHHPALTRREVRHQVRLVDVMPTCLALMDVAVPPGLDGVPLHDVVTGRAPPRHLPGYSETHYPREQVAATGGQFAWTHDKKSVRLANRTKTIFHLGSDRVEAYDLERDPLERHDLLEPRPGAAAPGAEPVRVAAEAVSFPSPLTEVP